MLVYWKNSPVYAQQQLFLLEGGCILCDGGYSCLCLSDEALLCTTPECCEGQVQQQAFTKCSIKMIKMVLHLLQVPRSKSHFCTCCIMLYNLYLDNGEICHVDVVAGNNVEAGNDA